MQRESSRGRERVGDDRIADWFGAACLAVAVAAGGLACAPGAQSAESEALAGIQPEQTRAFALVPTTVGVDLVSDFSRVSVSPDGLRWQAGADAPAWAWELVGVHGTGGTRIDLAPMVQASAVGHYVSVDHGIVTERYEPGDGTIEQSFVIHSAPALAPGEDLVIEGRVDCEGRFEGHDGAWRWAEDGGAIAMGPACAFDATGAPIAVDFDVDSEGTWLVVDGGELRAAAFPVVVDPVIGPAALVLTDVGTTGEATARAAAPQVAAGAGDFLVVYHADDTELGTADNEVEVAGRLVPADSSGAVTGETFRLSEQGEDGDAAFDAFDADVAWAPEIEEYLVVWSGDRIAGEDEIYAQRVADDGSLIGDVIRVSEDGEDGDTDIDALNPAVAWLPAVEKWVVAWDSDAIGNGDYEVYLRLVSADGTPEESRVWVSADLGTDESTARDSQLPRLAAATDGGFAVAFQADVEIGKDEAYVAVYADDLDVVSAPTLVSAMGEGTAFDAHAPDIAAGATGEGYLVVWTGDATASGDQLFDVWARRVDAAGSPVDDQFRMTTVSTENDASDAAVAFDEVDEEWLVVWSVETVSGAQARIEARTVSAAGIPVDETTTVFAAAAVTADADQPAVAFASAVDEYLVAFRADDALDGRVDDEDEIFARFFGDAEAPDSDDDGVRDEFDVCPEAWDPGQEDADDDGVGDACDDCPSEPAPDQPDGCPLAEDVGRDADVADVDTDAADADADAADGDVDATDAGADGDTEETPDAAPDADSTQTDTEDAPTDSAMSDAVDETTGSDAGVVVGSESPGGCACNAASPAPRFPGVVLFFAVLVLTRRRR